MTYSTGRSCLVATAAAAALSLIAAPPAAAHPHVFVDGGVDFVVSEGSKLEALEVTWIFDAFETLYILAAAGHTPTAAGTLEDASRRDLARQLSVWPEDFTGSAHLSIDGERVSLEQPTNFDVSLTDGRLEMTFERHLDSPTDIAVRRVEVGFYEATYFYAFSATNEAEIHGHGQQCSANVIRFNPTTQLAALQSTLFDLSREETPEIADVGALFADRIILRCG